VVRPNVAWLSREAEEAIFALGRVLSEGAMRDAGDGRRAYYGSTMITVELAALASRWRGALDEAALVALAQGSVRVRLRAARIARAEAASRASGALLLARTETRVVVRSRSLHLDVDLEAEIEVSSIVSGHR